jgi:hypothetical protein
MHGRRQGRLGRRGRLGRDGARHGVAERRGGEIPASLPRRLGARGCQQAAQVASSPPCVTPGQLLDGGEAATAADFYGGDTRVPVRFDASEGSS